MKIRMLAAGDVKAALPMPKAIEAMKQAYMQFSSGRSTVPLRTHVQTEKGVSLLMPAYLHDSRNLGVKIISIYEGNPQQNLPTISATALSGSVSEWKRMTTGLWTARLRKLWNRPGVPTLKSAARFRCRPGSNSHPAR